MTVIEMDKGEYEDIQGQLEIATRALRELVAAIDDPEMQEINSALTRARRVLEDVSE